jgi:hypothetical protein
VRLELMSEADCERVLNLLLACDLPIFDAQTCHLQLLMRALHDIHLHRDRCINLVVPTGLGSADFIRQLAELPARVVQESALDLQLYRYRGNNIFSTLEPHATSHDD